MNERVRQALFIAIVLGLLVALACGIRDADAPRPRPDVHAELAR